MDYDASYFTKPGSLAGLQSSTSPDGMVKSFPRTVGLFLQLGDG